MDCAGDARVETGVATLVAEDAFKHELAALRDAAGGSVRFIGNDLDPDCAQPISVFGVVHTGAVKSGCADELTGAPFEYGRNGRSLRARKFA